MENAERSDSIIVSDDIENMIFFIRGQKVMIDADIARLYGVATKALNQAVKRNPNRFPKDFIFLLSEGEKQEVVTNCDHLSKLRFSHRLPYAFTEQGIAIMRAFVRIRQLTTFNKDLVQKLAEIEHKIGHHDQDINELFSIVGRILRYDEQPNKKFGFDTEA